jgi:hypothetical protein
VPEPYSLPAPARIRFEAVSRGDLVPGRLWLSPGAEARPLVLVAPALGSNKDASEVEALCRALIAVDLSAAAIDLPLHGERASAKLSARLLRCASRGDLLSAPDRLLWNEYRQQLGRDLDAAHDALLARGAVARGAFGCAAFEPGAELVLGWAAQRLGVCAQQRILPESDPAQLAARMREQLS